MKQNFQMAPFIFCVKVSSTAYYLEKEKCNFHGTDSPKYLLKSSTYILNLKKLSPYILKCKV